VPGVNPYVNAVLPTIGIACARLLGTTIRTPFDVIKVRLQVEGNVKNAHQHRNTLSAFKSMWRMEGVRGFLQFVPIAIMRDAPFSFLYFTSYEMFKNVQRSIFYRSVTGQPVDISALQAWNHFLAGALAGAFSSSLTIPFDVVKTRLQTQATLEKQRYSGVIDAFKTIWREEGIRGLTRGLRARIMYITPGTNLMLNNSWY
jgi:hypothetical protein